MITNICKSCNIRIVIVQVLATKMKKDYLANNEFRVEEDSKGREKTFTKREKKIELGPGIQTTTRKEISGKGLAINVLDKILII